MYSLIMISNVSETCSWIYILIQIQFLFDGFFFFVEPLLPVPLQG